MNEHDGKLDSAIDKIKKFRWSLVIKDQDHVVLSDCFVRVRLHEFESLLRVLPANDKKLNYELVNVRHGSPVYATLEGLKFDTHYNVEMNLHSGYGMPGEIMEVWKLPASKITERVFLGQPDGLFTIRLDIAYNTLEHVPSKQIERVPG